MRTGVAFALGTVTGVIGAVAAALLAVWVLTPPPEKFAENYIRKREGQLGMSCQNLSAKAGGFIEQHVPTVIKASQSGDQLTQARYKILQEETTKLVEAGQVCLGIERVAKDANMPFPQELERQWKVLAALDKLFETYLKESRDPSKFGHVWKSAAVSHLEMVYGDLTAASTPTRASPARAGDTGR